MTDQELIAAATAVAGADAVHTTPMHEAEGTAARIAVSPDTPAAVAGTLRWAASERLAVAIRGRAAASPWQQRTGPVDVVLRLDRLNAVIDHASGDLTATIQAGAVLDDVNGVLGRQGQSLPLDPPFSARATIGGVIATNESGPLRHRYGAPRDQVIGITVATVDGRLVRAGGRVVKNVAGYDLARLMCGSHGTLAVIVDATFKLAPVPAATATARLVGLDATTVRQVVARIDALQLEPMAVEVTGRVESDTAPLTLLVRFASVPQAVAAAVDDVQAIASSHGSRAEVLTGEAETVCWAAYAAAPFSGTNSVARLSWLPANLAGAVAAIADASRHAPITLSGRAVVGAGIVSVDGAPDAQAAALASLRAASAVGHVVVTHARPDVRAVVAPWGPEPVAGRLWAPIKRAWDPQGVLGAARGPM